MKSWVLPVAACIIALGAIDISAELRWDRALISEGEVWRLLSGHLVHSGWPHALVNLAALILLATVLGNTFPARTWLALMPATAVVVGTGLMMDGIWDRFIGFSGVLHGLIAAALSANTLRAARWKNYHAAGLAALWLKVLVECVGFAPAPAWLDVPVAVTAHLWGALAGTVLGALAQAGMQRAAPRAFAGRV